MKERKTTSDNNHKHIITQIANEAATNYTKVSSTFLHISLRYFVVPPLESLEDFRAERYSPKWGKKLSKTSIYFQCAHKLVSIPHLLFSFQRTQQYIFQKLSCVCELYFNKAVCAYKTYNEEKNSFKQLCENVKLFPILCRIFPTVMLTLSWPLIFGLKTRVSKQNKTQSKIKQMPLD